MEELFNPNYIHLYKCESGRLHCGREPRHEGFEILDDENKLKCPHSCEGCSRLFGPVEIAAAMEGCSPIVAAGRLLDMQPN